MHLKFLIMNMRSDETLPISSPSPSVKFFDRFLVSFVSIMLLEKSFVLDSSLKDLPIL